MITKIRKDYIAADLANVERMLSQVSDNDILTAMSLESRRDELVEQLQSLEDLRETYASAAIFFSGSPVVGSRGIASEFAGNAISKYQDLVSKIHSLRSKGILAQRGVVAGKELSKLHITNVVRGSFGFQLEEIADQSSLVDSSLKDAVDQATEVMQSFGSEEEERYVSAAATIDERVLSTVRDFFNLMKGDNACFRLVAGNIDRSFDRNAIERAAERAQATHVSDDNEIIIGQLSGIMTEARQFEFRTKSDRGTIRGKISGEITEEQLIEMNRIWLYKPVTASISVRKVLRGGRLKREIFTLREISPAPADGHEQDPTNQWGRF
ncbi:hypothetical protein [Azospirillum largimobile]